MSVTARIRPAIFAPVGSPGISDALLSSRMPHPIALLPEKSLCAVGAASLLLRPRPSLGFSPRLTRHLNASPRSTSAQLYRPIADRVPPSPHVSSRRSPSPTQHTHRVPLKAQKTRGDVG